MEALYTLNEAKDIILGEIGTERRDKYEAELKDELMSIEKRIGDKFKEGNELLIVVESENLSCKNKGKLCYYNDIGVCHKIKCRPSERSDKKQVNFIKTKN